jgi:hypothetical protein
MSRSTPSRAFLAASAFSLASSLAGLAAAQEDGCRQALALALDVSGSVAGALRATERQPAPPSTALGTAMAVGAQVLEQAPDCWSATLDISGDGKSNTGPRPQDLGNLAALDGITINGLVVMTIDGMGEGPGPEDLVSYYETLVIRGPDAFVETADGFEDYERTMRRKLLREIKALAVGALDTPPSGKPQ